MFEESKEILESARIAPELRRIVEATDRVAPAQPFKYTQRIYYVTQPKGQAIPQPHLIGKVFNISIGSKQD